MSTPDDPATRTVAVFGPDQSVPEPGQTLVPGTCIGPYVVEKLLGQGGMGEVYLAEQLEPVQRRVALKLLPAGPADSRRAALFTIESQMLANMQHPGIAQVYDAGSTDDGRPFFVMEYVDGEPLTDFCKRRDLALNDRLELFIRVCQGVHHAHQKGFVHRDLKPANILVGEVDGVARPRIIDFGVATATRWALGSESVAPRAGTPEYMSPEQAGVVDLDIDLRSDVFSLGAVLFELLLEGRPLDSEWYRSRVAPRTERLIKRPSEYLEGLDDQARRRLARSNGLSESAFRRLLRRDLDWIVLRAMQADRDHRYESAALLAEDVRRFLLRKPVKAAPASVRYRAGRYISRHRVSVSAASLVVLALIGGLAAAIAGFLQASEQRDRAERALALAEAVNSFLVEDLLGSADIEVAAEGGELTVREVLEQARMTAGERFTDRPDVEAGVRFMLATSLRGLGRHAIAEEEFRRAWELRQDEFGPDHRDTLQAAHRLASVIHHQGRLDEAEALYEKVHSSQVAQWGELDPDAIASLNSLAVRDWQAGEVERGIQRGKRARELATEELGSGHHETLVAINNLARLYRAAGREDEAERLALEAVEGRTELYGPDSLLTLESRNDLAGLYRGMGRDEEAAAQYEEVLDAYRRVAGAQHSGTVIATNNLARTYAGMGRQREAVPLYRQAIEEGEKVFSSDNWILALISANLGHSLALLGEREEAEHYLRAGLETLSEQFDESDPRVVRARDWLEDLVADEGPTSED